VYPVGRGIAYGGRAALRAMALGTFHIERSLPRHHGEQRPKRSTALRCVPNARRDVEVTSDKSILESLRSRRPNSCQLL